MIEVEPVQGAVLRPHPFIPNRLLALIQRNQSYGLIIENRLRNKVSPFHYIYYQSKFMNWSKYDNIME
jgi:hypothetical protein